MTAPPASTTTRWIGSAILLTLFALVGVIGRASSITLGLLLALLMFSPGGLRTLRYGQSNPVDWIFYGSFAALGIAFALSATSWDDFKYILNFAPYLLIAPMRKQFARLADGRAALTIAWMALAGTIILAGIAVLEVLIQGHSRANGPMNTFQFVYSTILLGFLALGGLFAPGAVRRWPFLVIPALATFTVMISGTRGALLAVPVLAVMAVIFAFMVLPRQRKIIALSGIAAIVLFVAFYGLALQLGLTRSISGLDVPRQILAGEALDTSSFERLTMLQGAWGAFLESPIWGHGWRDMVRAILPHVPPETVERMKSFRHLHNGYGNFAAGAGLIGLASFLLVLAAPVIGNLLMPRDSQSVVRLYFCLTLSLGYAAFECTYILLGFDFHGFQFVFMTAAFLGFVRDAPPPPDRATKEEAPT